MEIKGSNTILLHNISGDDLIQRIADKVTSNMLQAMQQKFEEKLLSSDEACKMFVPKISRQTLVSWRKQGLLPYQTIGNRSYFKTSDILHAGTQLRLYKRK